MLWPEEQDHPAPGPAMQAAFADACKALHIGEDLTPLLNDLYLPFAAWLMDRSSPDAPLVLGICGGQGSGKSTFSHLLAAVLDAAYGAKTAIISIDDIYKTRAERAEMAATIHPLFATRGVPGTHDVQLGIDTVEKLKSMQDGEAIALPRFDKAIDDRADESNWPVITERPDVIILEGWCVGAPPQGEDDLVTPANKLEAEEDLNGTWRNTVNEALENEYRDLWALLDVLVLLKVPSMEKVYEWRQLQEEKLAHKYNGAHSGNVKQLRIMSPAEITRFIAHYERLTRHILAHMPDDADIVIDIGTHHQPVEVRLKQGLVLQRGKG